jgi:ParB family chromosome partitioning protein
MSAKKSALGRGLGALLQDDDFDVLSGGTGVEGRAGVKEINLSEITPNPHQPRKLFNEDSLDELAESIKSQGVISPLIVAPRGVGAGYEIVAGERRFRASKLAGLETIPVIIRDDLSEENRLGIALIENVQREDLTAMEEARAYKDMMEQLDLTQQEISELVGKKRATVANSLRLLNLPKEMQDGIDSGDISAGHARSILSVVNPADQTLLFNRIKESGFSVREAERQAAELNRGVKSTGGEKTPDSTPAAKDPHIMTIEQQFIDHFGTKVQLKGSLKKGKIEIDYYSADDLERILEVLGKGKSF